MAVRATRERIETAIAHLHDLAAKKGDYAAILMRKHVAWYVRGLYDNSTLCREVNHSMSPAETEALLLRYLEKLEREPQPVAPSLTDTGESERNGNGADEHGSSPAP